MRLIKKLACCLVAAVPAVALAACSSSSSTGSTSGLVTSGPPPEVSSITLDVVSTVGAAGIYIAQDDGLFAKQGLNVKIKTITAGEAGMGDLQTGSAQLVEGNYVSFVLAQIAGKFAAPNPNNPTAVEPSKPINMRIIADTSQMQGGNQALYVMPNSGYKTVQDLVKVHADVAVNALHNFGTVLIGSLLDSDGYGVNALKEVPAVLPKIPAELAQGMFPAAWLPDPLGTEAMQKYGAVRVADFDQGSLQDWPIGTIVGNTPWIQSHPNTVGAFLRAFQEGQELADTDHSAAEAALVKNQVAPSKEVAATMTLDTYPLNMDIPVMQRVPDGMLQFGVITKQYNIADMIQPEPGEVGG